MDIINCDDFVQVKTDTPKAKENDDGRKMYFRNRYYKRRETTVDLHFYLEKEKDKAILDFLNSQGERGRSKIIKEAVAYYMQSTSHYELNVRQEPEEVAQVAEAVEEGEKK